MKPYCIVITGRPGSGKTTLSKKLARLICLPTLSRDEVKEGYVVSTGLSHDQLPDDTNKKATEAFFKAVHLLLDSGVSLIVEAAFQQRVWRAVIPDWERISRVRILLCDPAPELCAQRHLERGLANPKRELFHGDPRVRHFRETGEALGPSAYEKPEFSCPILEIDTENDYNPSIKEMVDWLKIDGPVGSPLTD